MTVRERSGKRRGSAAFERPGNSPGPPRPAPLEDEHRTGRPPRRSAPTVPGNGPPAAGRDIPGHEEARRHPVRRDHEILDELLRPVFPFDLEIPDLLLVEYRTRLDRFQVQGPVLMPEQLELLRREVLGPEVRIEALHSRDRLRHRPLPLQPGRHAVVGQLRPVADRGSVDLRPRSEPSSPITHLDDDGRAVFHVAKRREIGRQLLGKHREDLPRGIDRSGVLPRVLVDRRALFHEGVHVGDGDADLHRAARKNLRDGELVQVAGVVVVDRSPG